MITRIKNAVFVTDILERDKYLYIKDDKILEITQAEFPYDKEIDAEGLYVSPGFIDIHTHGAGGYNFTTGGVEGILGGAYCHAKYGTTTIFPTGSTAPMETLINYLESVRDAMKFNKPGFPHIAGSHLEGPYFSNGQKGAQDPKFLVVPKYEEYSKFVEVSQGTLKRISFAPELPGSLELCDYLAEQGIVAAYAHTAAVYSEIKPLIDKGCNVATHIYSGMECVTRRNLMRHLGAVETSYLEDSVIVEAICDGIHLPPELLKLVYKIKGPDKICLVTDSTLPACVDPDDFNSGKYGGNERNFVANGVCYLKDMTAFSGSIATTDRLVRVMYKQAEVPLCDCIKMMCEVPARTMKIFDRGQLKKDFYADMVFFDDDINVKKVIIEGTELVNQ